VRHMRRLTTTVRFTVIVALSLAAAVAAYLGLGRHREPRSAAVPAAPAPRVTSDAQGVAPPLARLAPSPAPAIPPSVAGPQPVARDPNASHVATVPPDLPPARDRLSRKDVRGLVERVFKGKLADRELTPRDYDRLVDAVMRLRSALRIVRRADESRAGGAALDKQRAAARSALTEIEGITGVPPSELGNVLVSDDDSTAAENDGAESPAPRGSPEAAHTDLRRAPVLGASNRAAEPPHA